MRAKPDVLLDHVRASLHRAQLGPRDHLIVGLSGGVDSQTLTHALATLRALGEGPEILAVHVNHRLRPESDQDAFDCRRAAERIGVPFHTLTVDVDQWGRKRGIEAAARQARYAALASVALRSGTAWIGLGHTLDDQVETILLRLARGTSLDGLAAMREISDRTVPFSPSGQVTSTMHLLRPMLSLRRAGIEAYAHEHGIVAVVDTSNADTRYRRNAMRHRVLPLLEQIVPAAASSLARSGKLLADDADLLTSLASTVFDDSFRRLGPCIQLDREAFRIAAVPLQRRVIVMAVHALAGELELSSERVEALREAALSGAVSRVIEVGDGVAALVDYDRLVLGPAETIEPTLRQNSGLPLFDPQTVRRIDRSQRIQLSGGWALEIQLQGTVRDWELRSRRPGDRLAVDGTRPTRLQDWYVNAKVPAYIRDNVPLLVHRGIVRWIAGFSSPVFEDVDSQLVARLAKLVLDER